jgi:hypothetical protein
MRGEEEGSHGEKRSSQMWSTWSEIQLRMWHSWQQPCLVILDLLFKRAVSWSVSQSLNMMGVLFFSLHDLYVGFTDCQVLFG